MIINYDNYLDFNYEYSKFIYNRLKSKLSIPDQYSSSFESEIKKSIIPGRMEVIQMTPLKIFDVAHNPDAILHLINSINKTYTGIAWKVVLGILQDKDINSIVNILKNFSNISSIELCGFEPFSVRYLKDRNLKILSFDELSRILLQPEPIVFTGSFRLRQFIAPEFLTKA